MRSALFKSDKKHKGQRRQDLFRLFYHFYSSDFVRVHCCDDFDPYSLYDSVL